MGPDTLPGGGFGSVRDTHPLSIYVVMSGTTIGSGRKHFRLAGTDTRQGSTVYVATPCGASSNTSRERGSLMTNTVPTSEVRATLTTPP